MFHRDPQRPVFNGKPLFYLERSMARWVSSLGAIVYMVPEPDGASCPTVADVAQDLDGLVLQGGVDMAPQSYGEEPRKKEWAGDVLRDAYEMSLVRAMTDLDKPVLGVCRGHQVINVVFGGTLHQDILDELPGARVHRDAAIYDSLSHAIVIEPGGSLEKLYPGVTRATVNSVHHQAIKTPGQGVRVDARCEEDGVIEAITVQGPSFVRGVQWHPEFSDKELIRAPDLLDDAPILRQFLEAARDRRGKAA